MRTNIATIFDKNYIVRTLAFYEALSKFKKDYTFWFLCLDQETKEIMENLALPNTILISIKEMSDAELESTRSNRSPAEFAFTAKSAFVKFIADKLADGETLIFADNDIIYFKSPDDLLEKMSLEGKSIGISPHNFPSNKHHMNEKVGKYNAGLLYFILDKNSRQCIADWRKDCIEWCYLIYEKERFGDQKYIVKWPKRYQGVYEIPYKGINTGSWNLSNWKVAEKESGEFWIDEDPLVCYHFHRIKFYIEEGRAKIWPIHIYHDKLYSIYSEMMTRALQKIRSLDPSWKYGFTEKPDILRFLKQKTLKFLRQLKGNKSEEE